MSSTYNTMKNNNKLTLEFLFTQVSFEFLEETKLFSYLLRKNINNPRCLLQSTNEPLMPTYLLRALSMYNTISLCCNSHILF